MIKIKSHEELLEALNDCANYCKANFLPYILALDYDSSEDLLIVASGKVSQQSGLLLELSSEILETTVARAEVFGI